jgi:transcriptional regulator with PAS, ATPase and Fis domain
LLRTLGTALEVREIFGNMARIAQHFLAHDRLVLLLYDRNGRMAVRAASSGDGPSGWVGTAHAQPRTDVPTFSIVDDLAVGRRFAGQIDLRDRALAAGYRSILEVQSLAGPQRFSLQFWSKRRAAFSPADFAISGRVADHVALAIAHEQLTCRRAEVHESARLRPLASHRRARASEVPSRVVSGASDAWMTVLKQARQVAATDSTVLLTGESGTGKEVIARYIHEYSRRQGGPFVAVNCAALPEQLLEAELLGYERGAFTGAMHSKPGLIEQAGQGVLFFDEIGEMPRPAQAKLLRVVQEREYQRLGGVRVQRAHARMIAATNRNLHEAVQRREFREDLYYRLQVFEIHLPPLRERPTDVLPLAEHFLHEVGRTVGRPSAGLSAAAAGALVQYRWPGNVRQLRNVLERATILCDGGLITAGHLLLPPANPAVTAATTVSALERDLIERVLSECTGNKSQAARRLGVSRKQLYFRLDKYGIA